MKGAFNIGEFEVQPELNCVIRNGRSFHLEPKVMQVLVHLASNPNHVLSKEHLIHAVWPDTFVGDDVLTRSISEIRRVFDDDARSPRFIQTIPKTGYRLIMPVSIRPEISSNESKFAVAAPAMAPETHATSNLPKVVPARSLRTVAVPAALAVIVIAVLVFWIVRHTSSTGSSQAAPFKTIPLTTELGNETQPAFSPNGDQVAYVWNGGGDGFQHLYVKLIGTETAVRLTSGNADDFSPAWSPDGRSIAFLRVSPNDRGIFIVPAIGGTARKVFTPLGKIEWNRAALSWSPDGKRLIFPDGKSADSPSSIYALDLGTMSATAITAPTKLMDGDIGPAFSPDGKKIAFIRATENYVRDIYVMDAAGGEPRRVTNDNRYVNGIAWTGDSHSIVFASDRGGKFSLWRVSLRGGEPERLSVGGDGAFAPAISPRGDKLAYAQRAARHSILRIDLKSPKSGATPLLSSTQQDSAPQFSPDGSKIAFESWRSGTQEIWVGASNGTDLVKLTSFEGPLTGSPSWSPDGQQLAFDSRPKGHSHIYVISVTGGTPRAVTEGDYNNIVPSWSADGQWIYFGSNRSGSWQIWKVPSKGGSPEQVTRQGGFVAIGSPDGNWVYFAKADAPGIWRVPASGGDESQVLAQPRVGDWGYWALRGNTIYYLNSSSSPASIDSFDLALRRNTRIHTVEPANRPSAGISVSPDLKSLVFTDLTEGGDITLVEHFR